VEICIIAGRAGSGKSTFCIDGIIKHFNTDKNSPCYLIVPEQFTLQAERRLLGCEGNSFKSISDGLMENEVLSFKRMAFRVLSRYGGLCKARLNPSGRIMLLTYVMKQIKDELSYYSEFNEKPAEITKLLGLIDEFGRYEVTSDKLRDIINDTINKNVNENFNKKLSDLALIYEKYREKLTKDYSDEEDIYKALVDKLIIYKPFQDATMWFDEFAGFTSFECDIIEQLMKQCKKIYICCSMDNTTNPLFDGGRNTYKKIKEIAEMTGNTIKVIYLDSENMPRYKDNKDIGHLEKQYHAYPCQKLFGEPSGIKLTECKSIYDEVESSAREIVKLCKDKGLFYKNISVVARDIGGYEQIIRAVYPAYGIQFFMDTKKSANNHPLTRLIIEVLEIIINNWKYQDVFSFLKTGLLDLDRECIDKLENYVLANGIKGKNEWAGNFNVDEETEKIREYIYNIISQFQNKFTKNTSIAQCCTTLCEFLMDLNIPQKMQEESDKYATEGLLQQADEYARIWNITMEVIEQMYLFMGDTSTKGIKNAKYVCDILKNGFAQYKINFIPPSADSVSVGNTERVGNREIKALILLGANEGIFPAGFSEDGLLNDDERGILRNKGVELADDSKTKSKLEQFMIYKVLSSPSDFLFISYALEQNDGSSMRPSVIIRRIKKIFPDLQVKFDISDSFQNHITLPGPFLNKVGAYSEHELFGSICAWYLESDQFKASFKKLINSKTPEENINVALDPILANLLFKIQNTAVMSITKIEKYNKCPYSFYVQYGIKAFPRSEDEFSVPDLGNFMHDLIESASNKITSSGMLLRDLTQDECNKFIDDSYDEVVDIIGINAMKSKESNKFLTKKLARYTAGALYAISKQISAGSFIPKGFEVKFGTGKDSDFPAVVVDVEDNKKVFLEGRVDRYDLYESEGVQYVRVVDYKSSDHTVSVEDVENGVSLQLITYVEAMVNGLQEKNKKETEAAGAVYFTFREDVSKQKNHPSQDDNVSQQYNMTGFLLEDEKIQELMDGGKDKEKCVKISKEGFDALRSDLHNAVRLAIGNISQGNIAVSPREEKNKSACDYCEYSSICGKKN